MSAIALISIISFSSCSSDDAVTPVNEEEVITTVRVDFMPDGGGSVITFKSTDYDGDGPDAPVISGGGNFTPGKVYSGHVTFLNELANPMENITAEVQQEGDQHQLFYQQSGLGTFEYDDEDVNGNPIGLAFTYTASPTPVTGTLTITLRHEPNKTAPGVAVGNITSAGGSTDAEVSFPVTVQ